MGGIYTWGLLRPFEWELPRRLENAARATASGGFEFAGPGIARTEAAPTWQAVAMGGGELRISLRARARVEDAPLGWIVTTALHVHRRNFGIGQDGDDLVFYLRMPGSDPGGRVRRAPVATVAGALAAGEWREITVDIGAHRLRVAVDGVVRVDRALNESPFPRWDPDYRLVVGNDPTYNRPWLGDVEALTFDAGGVEHRVRGGDLDVPARFWSVRNYPRFLPLRFSNRRDLLFNVALFVPLGAVLVWLARRRAWAAAGWAAAYSAGIEGLQLFVSARNPSIDDFWCNALGGWLGAFTAAWLAPGKGTEGTEPVLPRQICRPFRAGN